ncbi:MAG: YggS family pyridoxal phosphate-dependent enzyme [Myxococcota bacterium]|nr:YggS family pyridoxal phosphate-dependent enzyme [Myxococcota bacterium]
MSREAALLGNLAAVRERVARAATRAGRDPGSVRLVGAAKRQPPELLAAAVRAGLRDLAENYVQEAASKIPKVMEILGPEADPPRWHLIGRLQRNKARDAVAWFDCIHTVDSPRLAAALASRAARRERPVSVLLQVNLSAEPQKGGVEPEGAAALLQAVAAHAELRPCGLMTMPAPSPDPEAARPVFAALRALRDRLRQLPGGEPLADLSMGMSGDFEVAIEEGATMVRIGTAIFGPRET